MSQIDINKVPESDLNVMARSLITSVTAFFEDPENQRKFEEWQRQQKQKAETA